MLWKPSRRELIRTSALIAAPAIIGRRAHAACGSTIALTGAGCGAPGGASTGLRTSLSAFWDFSNTSWLDSTGNGNTLTPSATPPTVVAGPGTNSAASFVSGSSETLSVASNSGISVGGGSFSVQCWVNVLGAGNGVMSKDDGGFANREFALGGKFTGSANVYWGGFYAAGNNLTDNFTAVSVDSNFHHLILTWDQVTLRLYLDGNTTPITGTPLAGVASTSTLFFGKDPDGNGFATCKTALSGIWKGRVLSTGDMTLLYNSGSGLSYAAMA